MGRSSYPKVPPTGWCFCGCGGATDSHFVPGHDSHALWAIIRERWGTTADFVKDHNPSAGDPPSN
jgi:hypothetical protein